MPLVFNIVLICFFGMGEKMTKSFDEWRNEQRNKVDGYTERDAYEAGQQSKQAEIDELKREMLNKTNEAYADGQKSMRKMIKSNEDELQKRIDEALSCADKCTWNIALVELKKILKGDSHES